MAEKLDFKGMACPMPIMKTAMAFKKANSGDLFEIESDDPGFEADFIAWCSETENPLEGLTNKDGILKATIMKK